jgi:hypothetical protein
MCACGLQCCRCERCQRCLSTFNTTASATATAASVRAACIAAGRPSADCDRVEKAIAGSYKGNLAQRLGGICRVLGECDAGLATNATCVLSAGGNDGMLSECTLEGVNFGSAVDGIFTTGGPADSCKNAATWATFNSACTADGSLVVVG